MTDIPRELVVPTVLDTRTGEKVEPAELERRQAYRARVTPIMLAMGQATVVSGEAIPNEERLAREDAGRRLATRQEERTKRAGSMVPLISLLRVRDALEARIAALECRLTALEAAHPQAVSDEPKSIIERLFA
ncbi:MAG: hypothetical protein U1E63_07135 [Burkholderiales bacterium]